MSEMLHSTEAPVAPAMIALPDREAVTAQQQPMLAPREREVLQHISEGRTYLQTARRMGVTSYTVDTYLRRIRSKSGAGNKAELTRLAISLGL
ncbi:response regulator transcription factor [Kitasatospora camelliae]|uniref:Helix-turn-helix transcriptional regulator n=1 Tax=Kitasatospora camelliae TaxID=3156397 RepID=A0AAU8K7X7_9ACTN